MLFLLKWRDNSVVSHAFKFVWMHNANSLMSLLVSTRVNLLVMNGWCLIRVPILPPSLDLFRSLLLPASWVHGYARLVDAQTSMLTKPAAVLCAWAAGLSWKTTSLCLRSSSWKTAEGVRQLSASSSQLMVSPALCGANTECLLLCCGLVENKSV